MCSIQEENELLQPLKREENSTVCRKCMKCDNPAVVVIRANDPMCSACFVAYTTHKFRSAFGKSRVVRDQERVLVAYSGGAAAGAMVHLTQGGLSKRAQKKLRFIPSLVYIDEGAVIGQSVAERCDVTRRVAGMMAATGLNYAFYCLEQALHDLSPGAPSPVPPLVVADGIAELGGLEADYTERRPLTATLQDTLTSARSLTARHTLVHTLRMRLLSLVARQQGVTKVLLGDTATRLSVRLLSSITQGQGAHLPYQIGFADKHDKDCMFIRPMREFSGKEVAMYNQLNNVETVFIPNLTTKVNAGGSLWSLTESFVTGLQAEYPNTVSTILRTGDKFDLSQSATNVDRETCCICQCPLDTDVGSCAALSATKFSQTLCSNMAARQAQPVTMATTATPEGSKVTSCCEKSKVDSCCGEGDGSCQKSDNNQLTFEDLEPWLCYGCRVMTKDMVKIDKLPAPMISDATRRIRRAQMKEEIADFLLDE